MNLTTAGNWDEAVVSNSDVVLARLPYRSVRRYGATILTQPRLTPYAGPWFRPSSAKSSNQFSERRRLTTELLAQLPRFDLFSQNLWPAISDWLPFYWAGYSQSTGYTNWLRDLSDPEVLWANFLNDARAKIVKAQQRVEVVVSNDVERLCDLHEKSFAQQGTGAPRERALLRRVVEGAISQGHGRVTLAVDGASNVHAAAFVVFDERSAHYLISGTDAQHRASGAANLLVWDAIKFAAGKCALFDFEGSMVEGISRFFRAFNPELMPVLHVYRTSRRASFAAALYNLGAALLGRPALRF